MFSTLKTLSMETLSILFLPLDYWQSDISDKAIHNALSRYWNSYFSGIRDLVSSILVSAKSLKLLVQTRLTNQIIHLLLASESWWSKNFRISHYIWFISAFKVTFVHNYKLHFFHQGRYRKISEFEENFWCKLFFPFFAIDSWFAENVKKYFIKQSLLEFIKSGFHIPTNSMSCVKVSTQSFQLDLEYLTEKLLNLYHFSEFWLTRLQENAFSPDIPRYSVFYFSKYC